MLSDMKLYTMYNAAAGQKNAFMSKNGRAQTSSTNRGNST